MHEPSPVPTRGDDAVVARTTARRLVWMGLGLTLLLGLFGLLARLQMIAWGLVRSALDPSLRAPPVPTEELKLAEGYVEQALTVPKQGPLMPYSMLTWAQADEAIVRSNVSG